MGRVPTASLKLTFKIFKTVRLKENMFWMKNAFRSSLQFTFKTV